MTASAKIQNPEYVQARKEMAQLIATEAAAAVATTGDADSFGRYVKFTGVMTTGSIILSQDCTPDPAFPFGPEDHCFVANAAPGPTTRFQLSPSYKIENAVLNDPSLINPLTGLPFGGSFTVGLPGIRHSLNLAGSTTLVESASIVYGVRFVAD